MFRSLFPPLLTTFGIAHFVAIVDIDLHAQAGENGVKAAKQRKSRMKKLDKLGVMAAGEGRKFKASYDGQAEEIEAYEEDEEVVLHFPDPGGFDGNIVTLEQVTFGYTAEKLLLENAEMTIDLQSRGKFSV
jgi:ATPase subunit of ABC transporter with duplicated ATPase domains